MPDPKDNTKQTGDTHPPEVEERSGAPGAAGSPPERDPGRDQEDEARARTSPGS